ncbi:flagellin [Altererythrobacter sp. H2]|uniref:flagellin n=1 Tax=Altererythrobacter sp. H2 TaxID=3108391 RepID=UPI002B4BA967|nr:flagellin [Altererythrobacter sp. H2]WRK96967.1 flagellin [Altererythrobacter sp. H2]
MLALLDDPATAYRRVDLDARIEGSDGAGLTRLCLERAIAALARARTQDGRAQRAGALEQAGSALIALLGGVASDNPLRSALVQFYGGARADVMASLTRFDPERLAGIERDLADVLALLQK